MPRNPMAFSEHRPLMGTEGPQGDLRNKRKSIQQVLEAHGINRIDQMRDLTQEEVEEIRREVDYFEKNPEISDAEIAKYYQDGAELRTNIADLIGEKGREGLEEIKNNLPKRRVN